MSDALGALIALRELVKADAELEQFLLNLEDREEFLSAVVTTAQTHGLELSREDLSEAMNIARRQWIERWL